MDEVERVYAVLVAGGLALVPTCAGYGLVGMGGDAVERVYALKGRPSTKPCITVATAAVLDGVTTGIDPDVRDWILATTRSAPLAVVAPLRSDAPAIERLEPAVRRQCTSDGTIAVFLNAGVLVTALAERAWAEGRLVVGSSANRSGAGNAYAPSEVTDAIRRGVDCVVDVGEVPRATPERLATTLLHLGSGRFLRRGIAADAIERSWAVRRSRDEGAPVPSP